MLVLVTGGVRSGKSRHAESLLHEAGSVTYIAPGPVPDPETDPDWAARVSAHQSSRPASWTTTETADVTAAVASATGPVMVDCLGTWVTRTLDEQALWEAPSDEVAAVIEAQAKDLADAVAARDEVIVVTNEVGWGVVPGHRSGVIFRDALGRTNQLVAAACDEVHLVVSGRVVRL